jgi:hypothetical protein
MSKITLNNVADITQATSAQTTINANSSTVQTAFDNTLSRDGTSPNQMGAPLDMNNNQIVNLPGPASGSSPLRLQDYNTLISGGTISTVPVGGATGDVLIKNSATNFDMAWSANPADNAAGTNITLTGTNPVTIATVNNPVFSTSVTTPTLVNTGTLTLPTSTDTLVGKNTTDVLTNKTLTSPTLTSPTISTSLTANNLVTNAALSQMAANTIKANNTGGTANAADITVPNLAAMFPVHTTSVVTTGSHTGGFSANGTGTYTTPANCTAIWVRCIGGGGGGAGSGTTPGAATGGGTTTFGSSLLTAGGGAAGSSAGNGANVAGGTASGGDLNLVGAVGGTPAASASTAGGPGGASPVFGVQSNNFVFSVNAGGPAPANTGSGGSGASCSATVNAGGGGAGGGYVEKLITSPLATYAYTVGAAGTGGTLGTSGAAGGNGSAGLIIIHEYYI